MAEISFELYNNQLVQQLVGPQDANLKLLEQLLNVTIGSFGNQITVQGDAEAIEQARTAIDMLYNKVSRGIDVNEQEVKAAVRLSDEGAAKIDENNLNDIVLKTKKRHIYPRSATQAQYIQEMLNNGATLGSHSVSHLYPRSWRAAQRKGTQAVLDLATAEIGNSRKILQGKFPGSSVEAYCYPGGFILPEMISKAEEAGFQAAFTVIPKKVTKDTDRWRIHRYMVFGKDPKTFTRALNFNVPSTPETPAATPGNSSGKKLNSYPAPAQPVYPAANTVVKNQTPDISISLAGEPSLEPKQMEMRVSGFGLVNARYDAKEKILKWTPSRPLRLSPVTVQVRWKNPAVNMWQTATWQFGIEEQEMHFTPRNIVK